MSWWDTFFKWPIGGIYSNLLASAIWATPTVIVLMKKMTKHHQRMEASMRALHKHVGSNYKEIE